MQWVFQERGSCVGVCVQSSWMVEGLICDDSACHEECQLATRTCHKLFVT